MSVESILRELSAEISSSIRALTVNRKFSDDASRFQEHDYKKAGKDVTEMTGIPRLFDISDWSIMGRWHTGYAFDGPIYECKVTFIYPDSDEWNRAAIDDLEEMRHWFLNNHGGSGVTGVAARFFVLDEQITPTPYPDDPWASYVLTMRAYTETAFTNN